MVFNFKTPLIVLGTLAFGLTLGANTASAQNDAMMKRGKMVWNNKGCAGCHGIGKKMAGPDLAGLESRRSKEWLSKWLKDTDVMLASDSTAQAMLAEWQGIRMPKQNMTDQDVDAVLAYIKAEDAKMRK
jgi:cytochrome c551/c552